MTIKAKSGGSWWTVLLIVAAIAVWAYDQKKSLDSPAKKPTASRTEKSTPPPKAKPSPATKGSEKIGGYEVYRNCTLAETRNNDGDSFMVNLPDGKKSELRLYFVDTPESAFKSYRGGETNHQRIDEQAADMGGITPQQAVQVGQDAKHFTLALLASRPFDIYTCWDSPYHDERYHAFVEVKQDGKSRWLHELLVKKGFVRIHTKGADLPDGTTAAKHKAQLKNLESTAKKAEAGAWGK
ncbi:MAG: thermonuclease family protein [Verrucomicrobiota bacterium]